MDVSLFTHFREYEEVLAESLRGVASEMRLVDVGELIAYIRTERDGHIASLVAAASELSFKPGSLTFAAAADCDVDWGGAPSILLGLEFANMGFRVYFTLVLQSRRAAVEIDYMTRDDAPVVDASHKEALALALADASRAVVEPA